MIPCGVCGGDLAAESTFVDAECEITMSPAECPFEPQEHDPYRCAVDGWLKIEHEEFSQERVHGSCFLDNDDILVEA